MGGLEDAHALGFQGAPTILIKPLQDVLGIGDPFANIDLEFNRENLAHIDLFLWHKQFKQGQFVPSSIGCGGAGLHSGQFQGLRCQYLPANFGFQGGDNELARLGGSERKGLDDTSREPAVINAHVMRTPSAGDLQIGELRERRD